MALIPAGSNQLLPAPHRPTPARAGSLLKTIPTHKYLPMIETQVTQIADIALKFIRWQAGSFNMGSDHGLPLEQPIREVVIPTPFWIATTLVTQELWVKVMSDNPSAFGGSNTLPVDGVSYDGAIAFCDSAAILNGHRFAIPTEAQWEYACRAGTTSEYFWGSSPSEAAKYGWFDMNAQAKTHKVASLEANPWGLFDIVINLWEWCNDVWHSDYHEAPPTDESWQSNTEGQPRRCLRGGAWDMDVFRLRSAYRSFDHRNLGTSRFGLRIVMA